jgi:hypothetical protein
MNGSGTFAVRAGERRWNALAAVLLAVALLLGSAPIAGAQGGIRVESSEAIVAFGQAITFRATFASASPITEVILFYGREGEPLVRRIYPTFTPGTRVSVSYVEELESGQFPPGALLRVYWSVRAQDGVSLTTPATRLEHADDRFTWQVLTSKGVELRWYGGQREQNRALDLLRHAEEVLQRLQDEMGVVADRRVTIYVYNTQRDMAPALGTRSEGYDEMIMTLGVAMDGATLLLLGSHRDVMLTTAHELSHVITGIATDNPYVTIPRWFDEGLAMYAQGELAADNRNAVARAVKDDTLLSVRSMSSYSGRAELVDLFYGQAYLLIEFMLETYGRDRMQALVAGFGEGLPQEAALQRAYGFGLDELNDLWRQSQGLAPRKTGALSGRPLPARALPAGG